MKKAIFLLAMVAMTVSVMSVPVFAHGGHGRGHGTRRQTADYAVCTADGCTQAGLHEHEGSWYYCADHGAGGCAGGACRGA